MADGKQRRFYLLTYPDGSPMFIEDMGNLLGITGVLVQGKGGSALILSPNADEITSHGFPEGEFPDLAGKFLLDLPVYKPSAAEWSEAIRMSDDPQVFVRDAEGNTKIMLSKMRGAISGQVQQKIWVRDRLMCLFCGRKMGDVGLTVDHFVPLELEGANDETNYLSSCRACNRRKGDTHPLEFCMAEGYDYSGLRDYLAGKIPVEGVKHLAGKF